ncbi:MAG: GAF domain-containing sensor histidine kinase [Chitinophagales bacterium]
MKAFDKRISTLKNLQILDTPNEAIFDDIVKTASLVCNAPISLITLLDTDRQWFKAKVGVPLTETPRNISICAHAIEEEAGFMLISDLTKDDRFKNNPFVTGSPFVKSYAGVSLTTENGLNIGTVCILDDKPRIFTEKEINLLHTFSKYVVCLINEKKKVQEISAKNKALALMNNNLETFAYSVAHDVKAPLRHIVSFSSLLLRNKKSNLSKEEKTNLTFINNAAKDLTNMTQNLLEFSKKTQLDNSDFEYLNMSSLIQETALILNPDHVVEIIYTEQLPIIFTSKQVMKQVFQNLISNAIQYRDEQKATCFINISFSEDEKGFRFNVTDNGIGINEDRKMELFQFFNKNANETTSSGIGLCIVKELLNKVEGNIIIESEEHIGTTAIVSIKK